MHFLAYVLIPAELWSTSWPRLDEATFPAVLVMTGDGAPRAVKLIPVDLETPRLGGADERLDSLLREDHG